MDEDITIQESFTKCFYRAQSELNSLAKVIIQYAKENKTENSTFCQIFNSMKEN